MNGQKTDVWVEFEELRKAMGNNEQIKLLGWGTYTAMVRAAQEQKVVESKKKPGKVQSLRLLPYPVRKKYVESTAPSKLVLETCPFKFRRLVAAILTVSNDDVHIRVPFDSVVDALNAQEMQTFPNGAMNNIPFWVQQACEGRWLQRNKVQGLACIWIGPKVSFFS